MTTVQTDVNAWYEGLTYLDMVQDVQRWLGVAAGDYNRYSEADICKALNVGAERFAKLTSCLITPVLIVCVANRQNYRLPYNTLKVISARYYTGDDRSSYQDLEILRDMEQMKLRDISFRGTTGCPVFLFPSYRSGNILNFGISPFPDTAGTAFDAANYGVLATATGYTNVGNVTGTAGASGASLVDSQARDFVALGVLVGYPVFNDTTGESGIITAITTTTAPNDTLTVTLSHSGSWTGGDTFSVPMAEYGVVMDAGSQETYTISSWYGTVADIYGLTGNLMLDIARKPIPLTVGGNTAVCEIPSAYQEAVIGYAVYRLGRAMYKGTTQLDKSDKGLGLFKDYVDEFNSTSEIKQSNNAVEVYDYL